MQSSDILPMRVPKRSDFGSGKPLSMRISIGRGGNRGLELAAIYPDLILFPRSERARMDPRNIDTFRGPFPAVLLLGSCGFNVKKCGCSGGPNKLVHFSGKVLNLTL